MVGHEHRDDGAGRENEGGEPRFSRRGLMAAAAVSAGSVAGAVGVGEAATRDAGPLPLVGGEIECIEKPNKLILRVGRAELDARLVPGAQIWRQGRAALDEFAVGETVTVEGTRRSDGTFSAVRLQLAFDLFTMTVEERGGNLLVGDYRRVEITP